MSGTHSRWRGPMHGRKPRLGTLQTPHKYFSTHETHERRPNLPDMGAYGFARQRTAGRC